MITAPAISRGPERLDVFCVSPGHSICHLSWDGTRWTDWTPVGGEAGSAVATAPHAVAWGPDRLDLFVLGTDLAIYHKWLSGESWSDWNRLGLMMSSPPYAVARRPGVLEVVAIGTDGLLYQKTWRDGRWQPSWHSLCGSTATSIPCAVLRQSGQVDVLFLGERERSTIRAPAEECRAGLPRGHSYAGPARRLLAGRSTRRVRCRGR